jgi:3-methylfumaryl-CoA hydratase
MSFDAYLGRQETRSDTVWPLLIEGLAATLDLPSPGAVLPPLWHWMLFQHYAPASGLGADGHPRRGGFLPPVDDLSRRMWAGGRIAFLAPLHAGEEVVRVSTITSITEKSGASGRLVFVTVLHEIAGEAGPAIREEQDIVYRGIDGAAVKQSPKAPMPPDGSLVRTLHPNAVLLYRYSALTGNSHRIHYDQEYTTRVEGYPGLVVHGPLQATLLAGIAQDAAGGAPITSFAFRGRRPAFHDRALTLIAVADGTCARAESRDESGAVCMDAEATFG